MENESLSKIFFKNRCFSHKKREGHKNKEALQLLVELLKVAATYSPPMQRSTIGDAECVGAAALAMPSPRGSAAPLCARLRLYPAPLMHREDNGAAHSWDITKGLSQKENRSLSFFERQREMIKVNG